MTLTPEVRFRIAALGDAAVLARFAAHTFVDAFGADNRPADLALFLAERYGEAQQAAELADADTITILGESDPGPAAFAQVRRSAAPTFVTDDAPVELWRFYVDRPWHGRGVAALLMRECMAAARRLGGRTLWLSVWQRNPRAIAFYRRQGFVVRGEAEFRVGMDRQKDHIMVAPVPAAGAPSESVE